MVCAGEREPHDPLGADDDKHHDHAADYHDGRSDDDNHEHTATDDLVTAVADEFKENEDLPNTSNPADWATIALRRGERIVSIKPLTGKPKHEEPQAEQAPAPVHELPLHLARLSRR